MAKLIVMIGAPASGKSTLANKMSDIVYKPCYVSRDHIRFSLLSEGENYFAHETEVFNTFVHCIVMGLIGGCSVFADATHLNKKSRRKLIEAVKNQYTFTDSDEIIALYCWAKDTKILKERNRLREGLEQVPEEVIDNMFNHIEPPMYSEGFDAIFSYNANKDAT